MGPLRADVGPTFTQRNDLAGYGVYLWWFLLFLWQVTGTFMVIFSVVKVVFMSVYGVSLWLLSLLLFFYSRLC